tara:strand:- start:2124 stop:3461 length:1338 start_codon:yes stop_codon:yes gene_type:complete
MPYTVSNTRGSTVATVQDGTTVAVGGVTLIGKNFTGYGDIIAEDFVRLLENNASTTAPTDPQEGQLWWDTTNQCLKTRLSGSNGWHPLNVHVGATYPHAATTGSLWYNTTTKQLNVNVDGTASGYKQFSAASDKSFSQVVTLTATHVDDDASKNNGFVVSDNIEVIAEAVQSKSGTIEVTRVVSPAGFRFADPGGGANVKLEKAIFDGYTAAITVGGSTTTQAGTLIHGVNTWDDLQSEGVAADGFTIGGVVYSATDFLRLTKNSGTNEIQTHIVPPTHGTPGQPSTTQQGTATIDLGADGRFFRNVYAMSMIAQYGDIAERYEADDEYDFGTVVSLAGEKEITQTTTFKDTKVFGVVSHKPGLKLNALAGDDATHPYIAYQGRVLTKVIGQVSKGDRIVSSSTPGVAQLVEDENNIDYRAVIGRSLVDKTSEEVELIPIAIGVK